MTLPQRQISNSLFDAMCRYIDQFLTPQVNPIINLWMFPELGYPKTAGLYMVVQLPNVLPH